MNKENIKLRFLNFKMLIPAIIMFIVVIAVCIVIFINAFKERTAMNAYSFGKLAEENGLAFYDCRMDEKYQAYTMYYLLMSEALEQDEYGYTTTDLPYVIYFFEFTSEEKANDYLEEAFDEDEIKTLGGISYRYRTQGINYKEYTYSLDNGLYIHGQRINNTLVLSAVYDSNYTNKVKDFLSKTGY
jgi:hypothetical protein